MRKTLPEPPPAWRTPLADFTKYLIASDRPGSTIYLRLYQLRRLSQAFADPWAVVPDDLVDWLAEREWSSETRRSFRSALRGFYMWATASGRVAVDPTLMLPAVHPAEGRPRPAPRDVVAAALLTAGPRERLMVMLGAYAGLRRGEIAAVHSTDVEPDLVGWSLRVNGKGRKVRLVPLDGDLSRLMRDLPAGWAFPSPSTGHLTPAHVGKLMSRLLGQGWTTHTLRHAFATRAYSANRDLLAVSELLGHAKPETTQRYILVPRDSLREAVAAAAA